MHSLTPNQELQLIQIAARRSVSLDQALQTALDAMLVEADTGKTWRGWTDKELELLRDSRNSPRAIARITGRSPAAVSQRRHLLAQEEGLTNLQRGPRRVKPTVTVPPTLTPLPTDEYRPACDRCDDRAAYRVSYPRHTRTPDARLCTEHAEAAAATQ